MFKGYVVYGPYLIESENRRYIQLYKSQQDRTIMSYARYLMSIHLDRELLPDEFVDHIDDNSLNDTIENFQILSQQENTAKNRHRTFITLICPNCNEEFQREIRQLKRKAKSQCCSRHCSGQYQHTAEFKAL